jgi:hypothetical protein
MIEGRSQQSSRTEIWTVAMHARRALTERAWEDRFDVGRYSKATQAGASGWRSLTPHVLFEWIIGKGILNL